MGSRNSFRESNGKSVILPNLSTLNWNILFTKLNVLTVPSNLEFKTIITGCGHWACEWEMTNFDHPAPT